MLICNRVKVSRKAANAKPKCFSGTHECSCRIRAAGLNAKTYSMISGQNVLLSEMQLINLDIPTGFSIWDIVIKYSSYDLVFSSSTLRRKKQCVKILSDLTECLCITGLMTPERKDR